MRLPVPSWRASLSLQGERPEHFPSACRPWRLPLLALMCLVLAACGTGAQQSPSPTSSADTAVPKPTQAAASAPQSAASKPAASQALATVQVFFTADGKVMPEPGQVTAENPARGAMELLLQGPQNASHFSEIPKGTRLLDLSVQDGTAKVSFDRTFFAPAGAAATELRLAQVVFTLTQFPTVTAVQLLQEGQPPPVMGEGFAANRPLTRRDFSRLA